MARLLSRWCGLAACKYKIYKARFCGHPQKIVTTDEKTEPNSTCINMYKVDKQRWVSVCRNVEYMLGEQLR